MAIRTRPQAERKTITGAQRSKLATLMTESGNRIVVMADRGRVVDGAGEEGHVPGDGHAPAVRMQLTAQEVQALTECNKESFWYRCVPLSIVFIGTTQILTNRGILKPHPRFGALFKNFGAALGAFIVGKISYQQACNEKLMKLENSPLADMLKRKHHRVPENQDLYSGASSVKETGDVRRAPRSLLTEDYDSSRLRDQSDRTIPMSAGEDYDGSQLRAQRDRTIPMSAMDERPQYGDKSPDSERDSASSRTSYDDLRRQNRTDFERNVNASRGGSQQEPDRLVTQGGRTAGSETARKRHVAKNQYGDEVEE